MPVRQAYINQPRRDPKIRAFDPDVGPDQVEYQLFPYEQGAGPAAVDNSRIELYDRVNSATQVKLTAMAGAQIHNPDTAETATSLEVAFVGRCVTLVYVANWNPVPTWVLCWHTMARPTEAGLLYGNIPSFSPGSSFTAVTDWESYAATPLYRRNTLPDPVTGIITIPRTGIYDIKASLTFQQGNTNKELAALLWVRINGAGGTDYVADSLQISDDKTDIRSLASPGLPSGRVAGDTLQLGISWINQSMGTCTFQPGSFEATLRYAG